MQEVQASLMKVGDMHKLLKAPMAVAVTGLVILGMAVAILSRPVEAAIDYNHMKLVSMDYMGEYSANSTGAFPPPSISADGRYVVFVSNSQDIVPNDTTAYGEDVFLRDQVNSTTTRMTQSNGTQWTFGASSGVISGNGRYVAYELGDSSRADYIYDVKNGTQSQFTSDFYPLSVSDDGRFVTGFLVGGAQGAYVYDRTLNTVKSMSVAAGTSTNVASGRPAMSCDGRFVAYSSSSSSIVAGDVNGKADIFVVDRVNGDLVKNITINGNGHSGNSSGTYGASVSCDGKNVGFLSDASNLVANDTNGVKDAFMYSTEDGTITRLSVATSGTQAVSGASSFVPYISNGGKYATFVSYGSDFGVTNSLGNSQVYLRDVANDTTVLASGLLIGGQPTPQAGHNHDPMLAANAGHIVFRSTAQYTNDPANGGRAQWQVYSMTTGNTAMSR